MGQLQRLRPPLRMDRIYASIRLGRKSHLIAPKTPHETVPCVCLYILLPLTGDN